MTASQPTPGRAAAPPVDADAFRAFEAAGWDHQAPTYERLIGRVTRRLVDPLLDAAEVGAGARVLDLGTGPGRVAAAAAGRGATVVGIDIAPTMVGLARRLHPGLDFRQADAEALPFDNSSFDAAVSNFLVPHLGRHERVVSELARVLKDDGRLALTTWDFPDRMRLLGLFLDAFAEAGAAPTDDIPAGPPFFFFADDERFTSLLADNGFTDVRVRTIAFSQFIDTADALWDGMLSGTVRTSSVYLGQSEQTRRRVRAAFDRLVLQYQQGDGFEVPVSVKLAQGRRAG